MTYREARVYLDDMSKYGSVLGLETIRGLLRELGNPQDDLKFIHIAGTNGKGSVLAYTSMILSEAGYRIGRYVSPTVVSYLERIQVDAEWISEEKFAELTERVRNAIARLEDAGEDFPTVFETETAIAFLYFREMKCDLVVLEAGLGGELDATNIIRNTVCAVFASISRDHLGVLGDTLTEIAENKAGIIKTGCAVISARQKDCVAEIIKRRAEQYGCSYVQAEPELADVAQEDYHGIYFSYKEFSPLHTVMAGKNQIGNAAVSLEVIRVLRKIGYEISDDAVRRGMARTQWPGRFSCIGEAPVFILDGAHNEEAALRLRESVEAYFPGHRLVGIMGVFRDKEYEKIAQIMGPFLSVAYAVDLPDAGRGLPSEDLAEALEKYCSCVRRPSGYRSGEKGCAAEPGDERIDRRRPGQAENVETAVRAALAEAGREDVILAFGSLSYLRQVKEAYDKAVW